jgi:hypothetical protein
MSIKKEDCPCYQCICIPICRNKKFTLLFRNCSLVDHFYHNLSFHESIEDFTKRFEILVNCLNPEWANNHMYTINQKGRS